ncbi:magnetosome protein MamQ [Terasakiella sp. SH-1]|uniref:magnetosome protein MamQ n=1 Tax=Terasakiella sp. SH-1 TaxID=2560057 RepID=UPI0010746EB8|nr:magnetosome protein MamQ [Terasakiella sp. SH-1]
MVNFFNTGNQAPSQELQRLKRSEAMLAQLYRDETEPRFSVPSMKGVKTLFLVSVLGILLFSGTLFYKFNDFIIFREDVLAKAGNLQSALQRRKDLFSNLVNLTLNHASLEHSIFSYTAKMRTEIIKKTGDVLPPEAVKDALGKNKDLAKGLGALGVGEANGADGLDLNDMGASLGRLLAVVEKYPDIKSAQTYTEAMVALVQMEDLITQRRMDYNESLRIYNSAISKFPWKILADFTNFPRFEYFNEKTITDSAPKLGLETYRPLVPFIDEGGGH